MTINGIEGTSRADTLNGTAGDDYVFGGGGDDLIYGRDGSDRLYGELDSDQIYGGEGLDQIFGGRGNDRLFGDSGEDYLDGGDGNDFLDGGDGDDYLVGGLGADELYGDEGSDHLDGGEGNDTYHLRSNTTQISDISGVDTAFVYASFVKLPTSVEYVFYHDGALALPYWIDALIYSDGSGKSFASLSDFDKRFYFHFPATIPDHHLGELDAVGWQAFSDIQQQRAIRALEYIATVIDVSFFELVGSDGQVDNLITFATNDQTETTLSAGYAYPLWWADYYGFKASDVFLNNKSSLNSLSDDNSPAGAILIHEIGHALGLKHPHDDGSFDPPYLDSSEDSLRWTMMSYEGRSSEYLKLEYSPLDIAALHYLYGPSESVRTGDDLYLIDQFSANFIWDALGDDTLSLVNCSQGATVYLTPGYWGYIGTTHGSQISSAGQITVNFGSEIENLIGSSKSDFLYGNNLSNQIQGGEGNDTLVGEGADDYLFGGPGVDFAVLHGLRLEYVLSRVDASYLISDTFTGRDGVDSLTFVERLKFSDVSLALDLEGNAGKAAKILGAVFGKESLSNKEYVGIGLSLLDGGMSYEALANLAMSVTNKTSATDICNLLWTNVIGTTPTASDIAPFKSMLDSGQLSVGALTTLAADASYNTTNIDLVGLASTGIEYI